MRLNHVVLGLGLLFATAAQSADKAPAGTYKIDPAHSKVTFEVPHLVISSVEGRFATFEGEVNYADAFAGSAVNVSVDAGSIDTDNDKRDEHLRSPDFFDVKNYPKLTFKSTKIEGTPEGFKLTGDLTMHGVTKPVTLEGKYNGYIKDQSGADRIAFKASGKVNRQDFGLKWNKAVEAGPVVGDEVTINLAVEANKAATTAKK